MYIAANNQMGIKSTIVLNTAIDRTFPNNGIVAHVAKSLHSIDLTSLLGYWDEE